MKNQVFFAFKKKDSFVETLKIFFPGYFTGRRKKEEEDFLQVFIAAYLTGWTSTFHCS